MKHAVQMMFSDCDEGYGGLLFQTDGSFFNIDIYIVNILIIFCNKFLIKSEY